ncbi:MAG: fibronectin type III domain-containing protein [Bacteroidia bacterium]|nr:fibronectin type III domain-containing protein [Bacteroidia bacterium]
MKHFYVLLLGLLLFSIMPDAQSQTDSTRNNPKIYIAFLWHMHQPIYRPYENIVQTQQSGVYSFSLYDVHLSRTGPYTDWPKNAVMKGINAGMPNFGAQVSFSGSLIENLNNLQAAGIGFSNWKSHWNYIKNQTTALGNPRLDMVGFGYHHPLMGLIDYQDIRKQIQRHKQIFAQNFTGNYSKGIFPPETAFSTRMIPALVDEGLEWVIIDNLHFERTAEGAPYADASGVPRPNKSTVRNPNPGDWKQLNGLWAPTPVSIRWAHQPRWVSYTDPATGVTKKIIGVPASRYLGEEDGRGGFGALNYDYVMSQFEQYNTDPSRPILIVLHHDGDNYGGGSEAYYNSNFQNFVNWLQANSSRFECTTIQDYLQRFPPPQNDVIYVQDGSWLGAAGGDQVFRKWNGDPGTYPGASGPYSPDRNSWGVMTAAKNIVQTADQINPNHPGTLQGWHYYLNGQASDYWYWDGTEIWDSNPTMAANQAVSNALPVAQGGPDLTPPAIYVPQRTPYNPGDIEWTSQGVRPSDFTVWTYVFDLNGLSSVQLKYRESVANQVGNDNLTYTGGPGVGPWQSKPMTGVSIPSITNPLPLYKAQEFSAMITGYTNKLLDYYVEATDNNGNVARSPIQHVWVGDGSGGSSSNVTISPSSPTANDVITITAAHATSVSLLHWGVNNWQRPIEAYRPAGTQLHSGSQAVQTPPTGQDNQGRYYWQLGPFNNPDQAVSVLNFVFKLSATQWDNNNGQDWNITIQPSQDPSPVSTNRTVSTLINTAYTFGSSDFAFTSPSGASFAAFQLQSLPAQGILTYNGQAAATLTDYANPALLVFNPAAGASGSPYTSFSFKVKDSNGLYSLQSYTMTVNVISPLPVGQNSSISIPVNTSHTFSSSNFPFSSPVGNTFAGIRLTSLPAAGSLMSGGNPVAVNDLIANVNQLVFTPAAGASGTPYTTFQFRLHDNQGLESQASYTMTINVTANYPAGISWLPQNPSNADMITIVVSQDASMSTNARLHWGVNNWTRPNEAYWPAGTTIWTDNVAARTPFTQSGNAWIVQLGPFNNPAQTVSSLNFVIHYGGNSWNNNNGQNWNISICNPPAPTTLSASIINSQTVELNWNSPAGISQWSIRYGLQGFNPESGGTHISNVTSRPFTISGLTPGSSYDFYVRAHCGLQGQSAWSQPLTLSLGGSSSQSLNFAEGYTWFSVNINPGSMQPGSLFPGLNPCYDDRIIGQTSFALFNGSNWVGSLTSLNANAMYKMKLCSPRSQTISGSPAPLSQLSLPAGFSWIGFAPQQCMSVNAALAGLNPPPANDDRIIGQNSFAVFNGSQWVGTLTQLCPGQGYVIRLSQAHSLSWPTAATNGSPVPEAIKTPQNKSQIQAGSNYQHTMPLIARLLVNGTQTINNPNDVLYAFIDGQCTGAGSPDSELGGLVLMNIGHNDSQMRYVHFKLWSHSMQRLISLNDSIVFEPLRLAGSLEAPVQFNLSGALGMGNQEHASVFISEAWPNPANQHINLRVKVNEPSVAQLQLVDQLGRTLRNVEYRLISGNNDLKISLFGFKPGIYQLVSTVVGASSQHRRVQSVVVSQ